MKRFLPVLVLIFIFGVSCGGIYQLTFGGGKLAPPAFVTESIEKFEQKQQEKKEKKEQEKRREQEILDKIKGEKGIEKSDSVSEPTVSESVSESGKVTSPDKICSTEGCGKAAFVEYHGKKLCAKCYSDIKNSESRN